MLSRPVILNVIHELCFSMLSLSGTF